MTQRLYPIGIQDFEKLRKEGYIYVDKTELIYRMIKTGSYYFLSRPKRFGKSLLMSTIEAYFLGKREVFEGLAMEKLEKEWTVHPVLHLDLNPAKYESADILYKTIEESLAKWERTYGIDKSEQTQSLRFKGIIARAYEKTGQRVVVLIDEYDKPLLQAIGNDDLQTEYRNILKAFYGVLKTMDRAIQFALLTGVTKFGKVSVFSDLNNLNDISMNTQFSAICGITDKEIHQYFEPELRNLGEALHLDYDATSLRLKENYDGYHFSEDSVDIYNPYSLLNTFYNNKLKDYWFETGTPTYLAELLMTNNFDLQRLISEETSSTVLMSVDSVSSISPIPVLYQSGYLTIKGYDEDFALYALGFPNKEVENGFLRFLIPFYTPVKPDSTDFEIGRFVGEIKNGEAELFLKRLTSFFADYPYEMIPNLELHYQNVLFIIFKLIGFYVKVEYHTSYGRIDLVLQTDKYIYIMEFKLNGSAEDAIHQINEKHYDVPFLNEKKKLFKIGINFSKETRNIEKWIVEE